jgi:hypothetical protein
MALCWHSPVVLSRRGGLIVLAFAQASAFAEPVRIFVGEAVKGIVSRAPA